MLAEACGSGNCGIEVTLEDSVHDPLSLLFAEELGLVLEVNDEHKQGILDRYRDTGLFCNEIGKVIIPLTDIHVSHVSLIGQVVKEKEITIAVNGQIVVAEHMVELRDVWESTSFELEKLQCAHQCVDEERLSLRHRQNPQWHLSFVPEFTSPNLLTTQQKIPVAIVRAEGSNGDREMAAAVYAAGMQPWDVTMEDLLQQRISLDDFSGLVFVGGFSFADVLDSAKGWAGTILFNPHLLQQFRQFYARPETFSLGVCNGCQLMALLGIVPGDAALGAEGGAVQPRFVHNTSGRFESRWSTVRFVM